MRGGVGGARPGVCLAKRLNFVQMSLELKDSMRCLLSEPTHRSRSQTPAAQVYPPRPQGSRAIPRHHSASARCRTHEPQHSLQQGLAKGSLAAMPNARRGRWRAWRQRRRRLLLPLAAAVPAQPDAARLGPGRGVAGATAAPRLAWSSQCTHPLHPSFT